MRPMRNTADHFFIPRFTDNTFLEIHIAALKHKKPRFSSEELRDKGPPGDEKKCCIEHLPHILFQRFSNAEVYHTVTFNGLAVFFFAEWNNLFILHFSKVKRAKSLENNFFSLFYRPDY